MKPVRFCSSAAARCVLREALCVMQSSSATSRVLTRGVWQKEMTALEELLMVGNPLYEEHTKNGDWRIQVAGRIPWLKKLDGVPLDDEEKEQGRALVGG